MAEATQPYHNLVSNEARSAIATLARLAAKKVVKRQLAAEGLKLTHYSAREIAILANDYLLEHRFELREHATAQYRRLVESGALRAPRPLRKSAR